MQDQMDLVVRGGMIYDGAGGDAYKADIAIKDGKIIGLFEDPGVEAQKGQMEFVNGCSIH
jgi:N-acyl-D-aspartate/D-glutamate deacylase